VVFFDLFYTRKDSMSCCGSRHSPTLPPSLLTINGLCADHAESLANALGFPLDDAALSSTAGGITTPLELERKVLIAAHRNAHRRPSPVAVSDAFESFAHALRSSETFTAAPVPVVSVLAFTPFNAVLEAAVGKLPKDHDGFFRAVNALLEYPVLFRGERTTAHQPPSLEYLRPSAVRQAMRRLQQVAPTDEFRRMVPDIERYLLTSLGMDPHSRGVYVTPRSPIYDVVVDTSHSLKHNQNKIVSGAKALLASQQKSKMLDSSWESHGGGTTLCKACFKKVAAAGLALLADPRSRKLAGLAPCTACLKNQIATLGGLYPTDEGYRVPRFSGSFGRPTSPALQASNVASSAVPVGYQLMRQVAYPDGENISCDLPPDITSAADQCRQDPNCKGFSTENGMPQCTKLRLGAQQSRGTADFYLNTTAVQFARIPSEAHSEILTSVCNDAENVLQVQNCLTYIPIPGAGLLGAVGGASSCIVNQLCYSKDRGLAAYEAAVTSCAAQYAAQGLARQLFGWIGLPFTVLACVGDVAALAGLYEPHLVDITMPSGHVWKWDTSGTVWGFFRNLSTGFHISGDEAWEEALKPSLLFLGKVGVGAHDAAVATGDALSAIPGAVASAAKSGAATVVDGIQGAASATGHGIVVAAETTGKAIAQAGSSTGAVLAEAAHATGQTLGHAADNVASAVSPAVAATGGFLGTVADGVAEGAKKAGDATVVAAGAVGHAVDDVVQKIPSAAAATGDAIVGVAGAAAVGAKKAGEVTGAAVSTVGQAVGGAATATGSAVKSVVPCTIPYSGGGPPSALFRSH